MNLTPEQNEQIRNVFLKHENMLKQKKEEKQKFIDAVMNILLN